MDFETTSKRLRRAQHDVLGRITNSDSTSHFEPHKMIHASLRFRPPVLKPVLLWNLFVRVIEATSRTFALIFC